MTESPEKLGIEYRLESSDVAWKDYMQLMQRARTEFPDVFGGRLGPVTEEESRMQLYSVDEETGLRKKWEIFARRAGVPVGMINAYRAFEHDEAVQNRAAITDLYVAPEARKGGIGKELLHSMLSALRAEGSFKVVELIVSRTQADAIRLYEEVGFKMVRESHMSRNDEVVMEMLL